MFNNRGIENNCFSQNSGCNRNEFDGCNRNDNNWNSCWDCGSWMNQGCNENSCEDNRCECEHEDNRMDRKIAREIREAICDIQEGIRLACEALKCIQRGNTCQAVKLLREAIRSLEKGIERLCCALEKLRIDNCRVERLIEEAICDLREGIKHLCTGLDFLLDNECCCAIKEIQRGIRDIELALRDVCAALEDFL